MQNNHEPAKLCASNYTSVLPEFLRAWRRASALCAGMKRLFFAHILNRFSLILFYIEQEIPRMAGPQKFKAAQIRKRR
jgi:hypothetical protein